MMDITLKPMESDEEIEGKAFVHWATWQSAYRGLVSDAYLDAFTLEKSVAMARRWTDGIIVAKDGERVVGFVGYGDRGDEAPGFGEIFALYVLPEYHGTGVGALLMRAGLEKLDGYPRICLWVLKENERAIRFYRRFGFVPDGEELHSAVIDADEVRMVLG